MPVLRRPSEPARETGKVQCVEIHFGGNVVNQAFKLEFVLPVERGSLSPCDARKA